MAFKHGKDTEVWLDGRDISTFLNDAGFSAETDTADTTTFKAQWKRAIPGASGAKVDFKGLYDPDLTDITDILGGSGSVVTVGPSGAALGDRARLLKILTTAYAEASPVGGAVAFTWAVLADDTVGFGTVLHAMAAETADVNGTAVDGGAASTDGAIAHLHVTSVSASDSVIVTIEDSADGSTGWATIGTFASKAAAGSERLEIAGTIRRYTRAVTDVTGTDVSIVYGLALARL